MRENPERRAYAKPALNVILLQQTKQLLQASTTVIPTSTPLPNYEFAPEETW